MTTVAIAIQTHIGWNTYTHTLYNIYNSAPINNPV